MYEIGINKYFVFTRINFTKIIVSELKIKML